MPIDEPCPECGGLSRVLISPGLAECSSVITWTEMERRIHYVTVEDPAIYDTFGFRGTKEVPVVRQVEVVRSRVCGHRYELETTMSTVVCVSGPEGKCGAFAVGYCADCEKSVCRHHGQYVEGRLLCDSCREVVEARRRAAEAEQVVAAEAAAAAERRLAAERSSAEEARRAQEERDRKKAYDALPLYGDADWISILKGGAEPQGKRPGPLIRQDVVRLLKAAGKVPQRVGYKPWTFMGMHGYWKTLGWVLGKTSREKYSYGDTTNVAVWIVLLQNGNVHHGYPHKHTVHVYSDNVAWTASVETLKAARAFLDARPTSLNQP